VPILAKTVRYDDGAQRDEGDQSDRHNCREPNEVFNVFEQSCASYSGRVSCNIATMLLDT
jgi:hypothetical protein